MYRTTKIQLIFSKYNDSQSIGDETIDENRISQKVLQSKEKTVLEIQRGYASHSFFFCAGEKLAQNPCQFYQSKQQLIFI